MEKLKKFGVFLLMFVVAAIVVKKVSALNTFIANA